LLAPALPHEEVQRVSSDGIVIVIVVALFGTVLVLQEQLPLWTARDWCRTRYVHARNGFYFNTLANRAIQAVWPAR